MYRSVLRGWPARLSASVASMFLDSRSAAVAGYRSLMSTTTRRQSHFTFCQWRYWKRVAEMQFHKSWRDYMTYQWTVPAAVLSTSARNGSSGSVHDVLKQYYALLEKDAFSPEHIIDFTTALRSVVYANLGWVPWLHNDNHIIAFMQILMNSAIDDLLTTPLHSHAHFKHLYNHIDESMDQVPVVHCPSILLSLLYSGLDTEDPLVCKLLYRCHDATSKLNVHQLRDLSHILQTLGGKDFPLAEKVVSRLDDIFSQDPQTVDFEIKDLCVMNPVLAVYMSKGLLEKCASAMLVKVQQQSPLLDIFTIGCCFRYARKMRFRVNSETLNEIALLGKAALDDLGDLSHLQSYHIAEICHNARRLGLFSGDFVNRVQAHSLQLLRRAEQNLHIRDVTNILFAFSKDSPSSVKAEVCQLLLDHLDDADVLTLSNIADNMLDIGLSDPELVSFFQYKVIQNIDSICSYITRLVKILRLLRERRDNSDRFNQEVTSVLLTRLDHRQGYDPTFVVVVAQFVLPNVRTVVPAVLMESLLRAIPRCSLSLMLMLVNSIEKIGSPKSRSLHNQLLELRLQLQQNIGHQVKNATYASQLADLVKGLHIKSKRRDYVLLEQIMEHYPSLTSSMSRQDYLKTLHVFRRLPQPCYVPQVFEDLTAFTKANYEQLNFSNVLDLVYILATAGYRPQGCDDFAAFTTKILEERLEEKKDSYSDHISLAHNLSLLHIFPDIALSTIFTFDYLQNLDTSLEASGEEWEGLKKLVMQLNRSVVLECPHLDVPWFHDQYCQNLAFRSSAKGFQRNAAFVQEVEAALQEVTAGLQFVQSNVYSPYYHAIDFEIVLDTEGQPVSSEVLKVVNPEELGYQRLAVMLIAQQQVCSNSVQPRGTYLRDRRHLEILGYRVVEIGRHDWHSMALADWDSKVTFVRNKIFHNGDHNLGLKAQDGAVHLSE